MKFQKLTIHNIASFEDAVIDFEAQPLADSEVFLITGKTGAGKTTILDAICLALFANTPRLDGTKMQGSTKDGDKIVQIDDPRQLMRRNKGEAFVSLTFLGNNNVHYEATWSVVRARKKVTGNIQSKDWVLKNLDTSQTLTKDKEVEAEIHAAIGLDFNQFCRTTMLAQGEFTRFLNSKDEEKAAILEKITGVDVYSKIGVKVFEVTCQKKQICDDAQRIVEGTTTLTDDQVAEKKEALFALDKQYSEIKTERDKDAAKRDWLIKDAELSKGKREAAEALHLANETVKSDIFRQKEQTVRDWNATIDARMWLSEIKKAERSQEEQKRILEELECTYSKLIGEEKYTENEADKISTEIDKIKSFLAKEEDKINVYENAQTIVGHLNTIDAGRKAIKKSRADIDLERKTLLEDLTPVFEKNKEVALNARNAFMVELSEVTTKEEAIAALNLPKLREKRDEAKELLGKITTAKERIETLATTRAQNEELRESLAQRKTSIEEKMEKSAAMEAPIHDATIRMNVRKEDLDKQIDTVHRFASNMRLKLKVGDVCPVCRQEIMSALPQEDDLAVLVGTLKKGYEDAEKELRNLVDAKVKLDADIKSESQTYERDIKAFREDKSVVNAEQKALEACKVCGFNTLVETTLAGLTALEGTTVQSFKESDASIREGEMQEALVKKLRKTLETKRKDVELIEAKIPEAEKAMNECKGRISTAEALVNSKNEEVGNAEHKVSELIVGNWHIDWKETPKEFASALTSSASIYHQNILRKQTLNSQLDAIKSNVENVQNVLSDILSVMPAWRDVKPSDIVRVDNLLAKTNTLQTAVATALSKMKTAEECLNVNQTKLIPFLSEHPELDMERLIALNTVSSNGIAREENSLKSARETVVAKKTLFDNAEALIAEHHSKQPEFEADDTLDAITLRIGGMEQLLSEIGEKKGAINQMLKTDMENKAHLKDLIEDADKKKADYQKWSRLNQLIGDAVGKKFRIIAQSYVLSSLIHSANSYMKTLSDRYTLKVTPGTFVITLEDAYQGFASRAASTISGGESFLVSLSLALALSDIGQTLSVDTLFIDEGFGSLSGEPLQNAINTLRSLHSKAGRHVGIISHVEELQERIPVQIQVIQEGNNSNSIVKIIPERFKSS